MKKKAFMGLWFLMIVGVLIGTVFAAKDNSSVKKVNLAMTYIPNVQFAPWYVADAKGFFKSEGLAVNFDYRMDIDALPLVAEGKMDFAIAGGDQVIIARAQNIPVVYLAALYAKFPPAIVALTESGIRKPQDLNGKKIGLPLYGTNLLAVKAILSKAGLKESDVELVDVGYTQVASLENHKVDAVVVFANNEPLKLKKDGYSITEIHAWDYFPLVGHGLITGAKTVSNSPDLVKRMVRATVKGMDYTLRHPDEAFVICLKYIPELGNDQREMEKTIFTSSLELWQNDFTRKAGLGSSDPMAWSESQDFMLKYGLIKKSTKVSEMLNTGIISGVTK